MSGYTPEEKLRLQQLRALRRRWLKDQELSPREPVLPPGWLGPVDAFWQRFLQPGGFWRHQVRPPLRRRGDTILETGEVMPPLADETSGHH
uniref:NADH dehydrogenase [ubiquinone] 1 beta subcomplex subunit 6 n=1 Tax=Crocodylus porosus TaxID=8502 RepID=A0A7M4G175_CROPO